MKKTFKYYRSLVLLFVPGILFILVIVFYHKHPSLQIANAFPYLPWQFWTIGLFGVIATIGGVLDWKFHRDPLQLKISKKEREAEAAALGLGGVPMFVLMSVATISSYTQILLIPIIIILIYTIVAICYDEFVFHINRCGKKETLYHRLLVFGNGIAWLAWFHFIYV